VSGMAALLAKPGPYSRAPAPRNRASSNDVGRQQVLEPRDAVLQPQLLALQPAQREAAERRALGRQGGDAGIEAAVVVAQPGQFGGGDFLGGHDVVGGHGGSAYGAAPRWRFEAGAAPVSCLRA